MTETIGVVQQFVERTGQLYSLPAVASEVLRLTGEPKIDTHQLRECLERDPALVTRLLRVVNSSLFGLSRQVTDLGQALSLLGIRPLKMLVLGFSLPRELFSGLEANVLARYWRRTLIKSIAARELAERFWRIPGDEAFIAGLVQDIGTLSLVQQLGLSYQQFLEHHYEHGGNVLAHEQDTLGFDHLLISARLLRHWGLPDGLCAAVAVHPKEAEVAALDVRERTLPQILHLADLVASLIERPFGPALCELLDCGGKYCGLTYEGLKPMVAELQTKVEEFADVLALALPSDERYSDLLIAAHKRLAEESISSVVLAAAPQAEEHLLSLARQMQCELAAVTGYSRGEAAAAPEAARQSAAAVDVGSSQRGAGPAVASKTATCGLAGGAQAVLEKRLSVAIAHSRQLHQPVTLALFGVERFDQVLSHSGPSGAVELMRALCVALEKWTCQRAGALLVSDSCVAMVWEDCSRNEAVQVARLALAKFKSRPKEYAGWSVGLALSAGLATLEAAPKNYPIDELMESAQRCLGAAQLSGGNTVKSIDV